jgi:hypothetical protein
MSDLQLITETLERAAGRRRRERAFRGLCKGFFWGACVWVLAMAVYKLAPVPMWTLSAAAGVWVLFALAGLVIGGWRKISVNQAARWVDGKQHLQERLSTALELAKQGEGSPAEPWRELIVTDAASHAKEVDPKSLVQFRLPRAT